jgi:hypothetical protein
MNSSPQSDRSKALETDGRGRGYWPNRTFLEENMA